MKEDMEKTPRGRGYGYLESDASSIRKLMNELGWTETRLAKEASLSQQQINRFLNGKRKLSSAASDRVIFALQSGREAKEADNETQAEVIHLDEARRLSPEGAARIRATAQHMLDRADGNESDNATGSKDGLSGFDLLLGLAPPPRDPVAYEAWKAKQIELLFASEELETARAWIREMETRNAELEKERDRWKEVASLAKEIISSLEETNSNAKEVIALHKGWVGRLQRQLVDAGITPTD